MRYLNYHFLSMVIFATFIIFSIVPISASSQGLEQQFSPSQGSNFKYHVNYERILPNGDFLGVVGALKINYLQKTNSTSIALTLEAIVDLAWIQGKQDLNFTQNILTRSIQIGDYQGEIITGVLYYFGKEARFFNPIYIPPKIIENKSDVFIWSYLAVNYNTRLIQWNYKEISVADYFFSDLEYSDLGANASYHQSTGILMFARCYFLEHTIPGIVQHVLYVNLESTSHPIEGTTDLTSIFFFLGFASLFTILPIILIFVWIFRKSNKFLEGGS